ncbi:MocR-like pyridoxine biosynthesis transcription factor PdxR [Rhizobium bangladeshense]|uniref:MocR-like pyridoxine biosynthesis transcription factor PdxR n=1 Tax=Rhizobium bangladeshense TaxID=1138189 RepID=UPI00287F5001|nr:PLP-dependent aminotransferase family protein [Rhizobium bangladeshense]
MGSLHPRLDVVEQIIQTGPSLACPSFMKPLGTNNSQAVTNVTWRRLFGALTKDGQALNLQIRRMIVHAIETGMLSKNTRLPSTRQLASLLGIARNTVTTAYQSLIDEGFLVSRERSGIFVAAGGNGRIKARHQADAVDDWSSRFAIKPSGLRQICKPRNWLDYAYPFLFGQYDPALFPTNNWREAVRAASSVKEIQGWAGDMIDDDDPDLVEQLQVQVLPRRGIFAGKGEIIVTIGSQQALSMLVQLLVGPTTAVGIEDPGYPDVRNMVSLATRNIVGLTLDRHGVLPDDDFVSRDVTFLTVSHQCPTTAVMPLDRRQQLLQIASRENVVIVEDDYEADLSIESDGDIPSLKSLDAEGRVIYVGSFSKVLAPGLRVGYIVAPPPVISELRVLRRLMLRHPPTNNQRALANFIALGHYRQHLGRTGAVMLERANLIADRLPDLVPSCRIIRGQGATSFWIEGPPGFDGRQLMDLARQSGVLVEAGDIFFADPLAGRRYLRLGFGSIATHRIEAGLFRLAKLIEKSVERSGTGLRDHGRQPGCHPAILV